MEPKSFTELWEEGCADLLTQWDCKHICYPEYSIYWEKDIKKFNIFGRCSLDFTGRKCEGSCLQYKEKKIIYYKRIIKEWIKKIK